MEKNSNVMKVSVLALIVSGFSLFSVISATTLSNPPSVSSPFEKILPSVFWCFFIVASIGAFFLKKWARIIIVLLSILWLAQDLKTILDISTGRVWTDPFFVILFILMPVIFLLFFTRPNVKEQFK